MDSENFDDGYYDLTNLDMKFLEMSPTAILNSAVQQSSPLESMAAALSSPDSPSTKRAKIDLLYPVDIMAKLTPIEPPKVEKIISNSFGWDAHYTMWRTVRS